MLLVLALSRGDEIRQRAERGIGRGMPTREAALARGFVLGEDEEIDAATEEDFRRAGLAHLLAVSGQNVTLLGLLALPLLGALGIPLRERLVWVLALIVLYVPMAGGGPSIQRAGIMGAAGLLATLAGRRPSRWYALGLAAALTVAVDPAIAADVGWQLSFAALVGILLVATPLREAIETWIGAGQARRVLAEGVALTVAATLATAPLIAFHFGTFSFVSLPANLLALPAVAPAMWLGMASAAASQVPGVPIEALNVPNAVLLAYIAEVAAWCAAPAWAELDVELGGGGLVAVYALVGLVVMLGRLGLHRRLPVPMTAVRRRWRFVVLAVVGVAVLWVAGATGNPTGPTRSVGLRVTVLDVGQGDAILRPPARAAPGLGDGGPPGDDLAEALTDAGVERLGALVVTHDQSDHAGGALELLGRVPVRRLLYARLGAAGRARALGAGVPLARISRGAALQAGLLRLRVLWPPPELLAEPLGDVDPNAQALVLLARWRHFSMLLSADAEAEAVPLDPGPVDVIKVAHHGSEDGGLAALLDRTRPALAVISVGAGNPYGHPAPTTLTTLASHRVRVLRTDRDGNVSIEVTGGRIEARADG